MIEWKRNLVMVGLSQFFSIMGFAFAMPFAPYYIQQLGITESNELKMWVALFTAAAPLTLAVASPIWGALSDRYGRRIMLLRANFGGVLVLALMGMVPNVQMLVILRLAQGVLTGTMNAAQTFVSVQSPPHRSGMVLGLLSAAVFSGSMCGAFVGGLFAEWFGYRMAFMASSVFLLLAGLLVLLGTREEFVRPMEEAGDSMEDRVRVFWGKIGPALPILALMAAMGFVLQFDGAWLPLLVQEIHGSLQGAAFWTGSLAAVGGIAGLLAGPIIGRIADRIAPPRIGKISACGAGLMMILVGLAHGFGLLFGARFGAIFCAGGLDPVFQIWLAKTTPPASRGFIFGWAVTARSLGWMAAPLASGAVAWMFGLRSVFFAAAAFFFLLIPLIALIVRYLPPVSPPSSCRRTCEKIGAHENSKPEPMEFLRKFAWMSVSFTGKINFYHSFSFMRGVKIFYLFACMYMPRELAAQLRQAIANWKRLEARIPARNVRVSSGTVRAMEIGQSGR